MVTALMTVPVTLGGCVKVDPAGSGWVTATDAALFLKRSGLADLVLGKVSKDSDERWRITSVLTLLLMLMVV